MVAIIGACLGAIMGYKFQLSFYLTCFSCLQVCWRCYYLKSSVLVESKWVVVSQSEANSRVSAPTRYYMLKFSYLHSDNILWVLIYLAYSSRLPTVAYFTNLIERIMKTNFLISCSCLTLSDCFFWVSGALTGS